VLPSLSLSNRVIPNPIMSSLTTHPAQHPHLSYTYLSLVLTLNRLTLRTIQQRRSNCCPIELSFQLKWYFLIAQNTRVSSPFQPPSLNTMTYICFYFKKNYYIRSKIAESFVKKNCSKIIDTSYFSTQYK